MNKYIIITIFAAAFSNRIAVASDSPRIAQASTKAMPSSSSDLKIKGLYIGMSISEAKIVLDKLLLGPGSKFTFGEESENSEEGNRQFNITYKTTLGSPTPYDCVTVKADGNKKVIKIDLLNEEVINALFDSKSMTADEFAQMFVNAYKLPTMQPGRWDANFIVTHNGWQCTTEGGVRVSLSRTMTVGNPGARANLVNNLPTKGLLMERAFNARETKGKFN